MMSIKEQSTKLISSLNALKAEYQEKAELQQKQLAQAKQEMQANKQQTEQATQAIDRLQKDI